MKVLPSLKRLSTVRSPPIPRARSRLIARPSPTPCWLASVCPRAVDGAIAPVPSRSPLQLGMHSPQALACLHVGQTSEEDRRPDGECGECQHEMGLKRRSACVPLGCTRYGSHLCGLSLGEMIRSTAATIRLGSIGSARYTSFPPSVPDRVAPLEITHVDASEFCRGPEPLIGARHTCRSADSSPGQPPLLRCVESRLIPRKGVGPIIRVLPPFFFLFEGAGDDRVGPG